ncbi:MAG: hypothetical protein K6F29_09740 [Bacteroidales bacterium]|nr:hypothetical protein [Bacteroidales bacterium]
MGEKIKEILKKGILYKREIAPSEMTEDLLGSQDTLIFEDGTSDLNNIKSDLSNIKNDIDTSIKVCKKEFALEMI